MRPCSRKLSGWLRPMIGRWRHRWSPRPAWTGSSSCMPCRCGGGDPGPDVPTLCDPEPCPTERAGGAPGRPGRGLDNAEFRGTPTGRHHRGICHAGACGLGIRGDGEPVGLADRPCRAAATGEPDGLVPIRRDPGGRPAQCELGEGAGRPCEPDAGGRINPPRCLRRKSGARPRADRPAPGRARTHPTGRPWCAAASGRSCGRRRRHSSSLRSR